MARATLISDRGNERDYQIRDGRIITLVYDDWDYSIRFKENNQYIGDEFRFIDEDVDEDGIGNGESYLLARMYSPVPKSGLGREAVKFFIDMTGARIYARPNDGQTRDDGSHLTEDAPGFVERMRGEHLIQ
ncbi:hypothetical protein [Hymenobacter cellulosilyticus]|uniref:Uncharacterized protein n=1 Tax=Hymenobacter cellulosilyticus TaxID=2932248 RepID=A0A8T9QC88_9BACT|nr:hypothetical protein [Hymenobacter cellulosilyticus]UOQ75156.1 hypothetical protein MUN79_28625 [Hymenobacter cellulosilyticus]